MLQKYSTWKVAQVFFDEPTQDHYLREISEKAGLSHTSVKNHLEYLGRSGIVEVENLERGERTYPIYKRVENDTFKFYKKLDIQYRLVSSGLLEFIEQKFNPDCMVLFGSAALGEDIEGSDIDIYVQANGEEVDLSDHEELFNRKIQLHFKERLEEYPKELVNNIANGIVVYGYLEVLR
ncbi:MAG: nucleotidyltransferase family protein [Candidatus Saliniplasma sp.]